MIYYKSHTGGCIYFKQTSASVWYVYCRGLWVRYFSPNIKYLTEITRTELNVGIMLEELKK